MSLAPAFTRDSLLRAFQRVESAGGIPGVDGVSLDAFRRQLDLNLDRLGCDLMDGTYSPLPLLQITVAEADGSPSLHYVPSARDRTAQGAVMSLVGPMLEQVQGRSVPAHLTSRCMRQAARRAGELWALGCRFVVDGQIDRFFRETSPAVVVERCAALLGDGAALKLVEGWVRAKVCDGERTGLLDRGLPIGAVIVRLLAGLLLGDLGEMLAAEGMQIVRYGDDLVVFAREPLSGRRYLEITAEVLAGLQLEMDPEDSRLTEFWKGMEYWGLLFPGDWTLAPWDRRARLRKILHVPLTP